MVGRQGRTQGLGRYSIIAGAAQDVGRRNRERRMLGGLSRRYRAASCAGTWLVRFDFFSLEGASNAPAASPAVSATVGSRETIAATMAPSISSASWWASICG